MFNRKYIFIPVYFPASYVSLPECSHLMILPLDLQDQLFSFWIATCELLKHHGPGPFQWSEQWKKRPWLFRVYGGLYTTGIIKTQYMDTY